MIPFLLLLSLTAFAGNDHPEPIFESSYARDNTFCQHNGRRIEILIRGSNRLIEPREAGYGEFLFFRKQKSSPVLLGMNARSDTFRFFYGKNTPCSKAQAYLVGPSKMAVLLHKENSPFKDKLVIQLFDLPGLIPSDFIETLYPTDKAIKIDKGFAFRTILENHRPDTGKVIIGKENYFFQESSFPVWMSYSPEGFTTEIGLTYDHFPWKEIFKDQNEFLKITNWDSLEKKFHNQVIYLAVNHKVKKRCFLFLKSKQKLEGTEDWRCESI